MSIVPTRKVGFHRSPISPLLALVAVAAATSAVALAPARASGNEPIGDPLPDIPRSAIQVGLKMVTSDVTAPLAGITAPGQSRKMYLVDQVGQLKELNIDAAGPVARLRTVLDVSAVLVGPLAPDDERGFLGAAFAPDGRLFTYTSEAFNPAVPATFPLPADPPGPCDLSGVVPDHRNVIREWEPASTRPLTFEPLAASRVLFTVDQPQANHNAGDMKFGPDGKLYIAFGDGGGADDQNCQTNFDDQPMFGHGARGNGQNPTNPLGDVLRIDVNGTNSANGRYGIPADNPFAASQPAGQLRELFAMGFRNPFRFSFDANDFTAANAGRPGQPWVADVGQNDVEEVNVVTSGGNYGWRVREGAFRFDPSRFQLKGSRSDGFVFARTTTSPTFTDPVAQYDHDDGTAIIGGYVYRGSSVPALRGQYVFGDTSRRLNNAHGRLFATSGAKTGPHRVVELREGPLDVQLIGFGQDEDRELYALVFEPGASGQVLRITR
ncbi:PQQ-dependent sugar dehydrogenase [Knoellia sp. S7-12]|uniref:PQQ-dependent sugar dehydrogenase n=1 Tax=Knoellia sp. S7-12 TaxID=3126698 RepID=UPI003368CD5B